MKENHKTSIDQLNGNKEKAIETLKYFYGKNKELQNNKNQKDNLEYTLK